MAVVKSCHEKINIPFDQDNIGHVHQIGEKYTDENTGEKIQPTIVKFKLWKFHKKFYARPRYFVNGKKKPGLNFFNVSVDLTRRCYLLLKTAKGLIKDKCNIGYAYTDINYSLGIKFKNASSALTITDSKGNCLQYCHQRENHQQQIFAL